jgi:hypothetical protein
MALKKISTFSPKSPEKVIIALTYRSPRTGYTYVDGPTYRNVWTPEREVPMPHMARLVTQMYTHLCSVNTYSMYVQMYWDRCYDF